MANLATRCAAAVLAATFAFPAGLLAQTYAADPAASVVAAPAAEEELDGLLAPVALYPDQLLAQVLMAATYPLDVVEAARFVREHPELRGQALDDALAPRRWDPSVLSLAAFPQVLDMMSERLDWTRRLGEVFLQDQDRVMQVVQDLRARAQAAGTLIDTPEQRVVVEDRAIVIEPARPDIVYVPFYDPTVVYGPWWAPGYVPFYWRPARLYYPGVLVTAGVVGFGFGYAITRDHWHWARPDWRSRHIAIDFGRHNRFIERRPQYREWARDGWWQREPLRGQGFRDRDMRRVPPGPALTRERAPATRRGEFQADSGRAPGAAPRAFAAPHGPTTNVPRADFRAPDTRRAARVPPPASTALAPNAPPARSYVPPRAEHVAPRLAPQAQGAPRPAPQVQGRSPPQAVAEHGGARGERREGGGRGEGPPRSDRGGGPRER